MILHKLNKYECSMGLPKVKFRELTFQILFSYEFFFNEDSEELCSMLMKKLKTTKKHVKQSLENVKKILDKVPEIDNQIKQMCVSYDFQRISKVELNVLRLAIFEMFYEELPFNIAISEAIRVCRKFSTPEGANFVNAILDGLCKANNAIKCEEVSIVK